MLEVTWDAFHSFVRPIVQNCPVSYVDAALRAAAAEFCQRSHLWNTETICGDIMAGQMEYKYNNLAGQISMVQPIAVIIRDSEQVGDKIVVKDHHIYPTNLTDLDRYYPDWRLWETDYPEKFYMKDANTLVLVGKPLTDKPDSLHMLCAVKPSVDAVECPAFLLDDWAEVIAAGALKRLLAMDGRVWANTQLVSYYNSIFRDGVSRAKEAEMKSHVRQSLRMVPVSMFSNNETC